jgi:phosphoribosylanthranilate isomerase
MTRVKICGITNLEDARVAAEAGADLLGFVFYPQSPRYVEPGSVCQIVQAIRRASFAVRFVGVFVDEAPGSVWQATSVCGLDYAQLHGSEPPETVLALRERGLDVIKAFRVRNGASLAEIERYRATAYLLDSYVPGQPGGTGQTFDWTLAARAKPYGPVILAGGLTPGNVAEAVRTVQPWCVDVSSAVEAAPGCKDPDKVRRFVDAARNSREV